MGLHPSDELARMLGSAHHAVGVSHGSRSEWAAALEQYGRAGRLQPSDDAVQINRALALRGLSREAEAEAALRLALRLNPRSALAYDNLGVLLVKRGAGGEGEGGGGEGGGEGEGGGGEGGGGEGGEGGEGGNEGGSM